MADVTINFMHPTDGRVISVTLDNTMTGQEVIAELIANDFVPASNEGYNIAIKGGEQLENEKTLLQNGVEDNQTIRVIPATDAGLLIFKS
ncbi:ubiquitin-like domain-containing protein [uncultured Psychroserpens sp.]|uniref:ubiquitin-like domain-containing protein n=1 Tax=uncultured Psychroserpens sp. TaxID=255436 RepID=UPI002633DCB6|nr:ubiquitin-like domain-containing protein [uncultured Psychroserpens sp.]